MFFFATTCFAKLSGEGFRGFAIVRRDPRKAKGVDCGCRELGLLGLQHMERVKRHTVSKVLDMVQTQHMEHLVKGPMALMRLKR